MVNMRSHRRKEYIKKMFGEHKYVIVKKILLHFNHKNQIKKNVTMQIGSGLNLHRKNQRKNDY